MLASARPNAVLGLPRGYGTPNWRALSAEILTISVFLSLLYVQGKAKKVKKNKMMKLDSRILGFSVTAAQDRINVGDRDYPNAS